MKVHSKCSDVKDDSNLGDPSWGLGLGLSPKGNLVLTVNLLCGPLGGQRSKVMGSLGGHRSWGQAQPTYDQASAPTVGWLTGNSVLGN